jgi:hypothetical protein
MHDVDTFESKVSAYPAITVLRRGKQGTAAITAYGIEDLAHELNHETHTP